MNPPNPTELEALFEMGQDHLEAGRPELALEVFETLIRLDPEAPAGHFLHGIALGTLNRHEEAVGAFKAAHDLAPDALPVLHNLALACLQTDRWQAAMYALTRYLDLSPNGDEFQINLLLGFAAAQACDVPLGLSVEEYLQRDAQNLHDGRYHIDLQDPLTFALMALGAAAQGVPDAAPDTIQSLRQYDALLADEVAAALPQLARWRAEQAVAEAGDTTPEVWPEGVDFDWEAGNETLRAQLALFARFVQSGQEPPLQAFEELLHAFSAASLLVPTDGETGNVLDANGEAQMSFGIVLHPHEDFGGKLVAIAFTGVAEARTYFAKGAALHRVVLPGNSLAGLLVAMARALNEHSEDGDDSALAALLVNPAGPHPFVFALRDLLLLANGNVPL